MQLFLTNICIVYMFSLSLSGFSRYSTVQRHMLNLAANATDVYVQVRIFQFSTCFLPDVYLFLVMWLAVVLSGLWA